MFEKASEILGFSMTDLCFDPAQTDRLNITEYTQPAMVTASLAMMRVFMERTGIRPDVAAGLSLGEYPAMAAAGVMSDEDAIRTVRQRGILMQGEVPVGQGAMSAVLAMDAEKIEEVIAPIEGVQIANYNCPGQIVISGKTEAVAEAGEKLKEAGAKRVLPLKVSGPFHSKMLVGAGEKLGKVLDTVEIHTPEIPYIANVTADYVTDAADVKPLLMKQVSSSVRWEQTIRKMLADGVDTFIEIGPGKTLTGFMRKIDKNAKAFNIEKLEDIDKVKGAFIAGNQLQLILGAGTVNDVYEVFAEYTNTQNMSLGDLKEESAKRQNPLQAVIKALSDVFIGIMPALLAAALLMGITSVLGGLEVVKTHDTLYAINRLVSLASTGIFAILPMAVCYSAVKRFGGNPVLGMVIGAIMLDSSLANAYQAAQGTVDMKLSVCSD